jgi:hypothetical protein
MEAGQFEWRNVWLVYNQFSIGISERFSTSASLLYIPNLLDSDFDFAFFLNAAYSVYQRENQYYLKISGLVGKVPFFEFSDTGLVGMYATNTFGNPRNNISLGIGYGYSFEPDENTEDLGGFLLTSVAGNVLLSKHFSLVTEVFITQEVFGILAFRWKFENFYFEAGPLLSTSGLGLVHLGLGLNILSKRK